jgi:hypothetical protein
MQGGWSEGRGWERGSGQGRLSERDIVCTMATAVFCTSVIVGCAGVQAANIMTGNAMII